MENDVLKNKIAPWQKKGRWYHFAFYSNGTSWLLDIDNSDSKFSSSYGGNASLVLIPKSEGEIIDMKITNLKAASSVIYYRDIYLYLTTDGSQRVQFINANTYPINENIDFYVFMSF